MALAVLPTSAEAKARSSSKRSEHITFRHRCTPGRSLSIAAVGDLLFHKRLQLQAYRRGGSFKKFWAPVRGVLAQADMTYGNLEGPAARGVRVGGRNARDPGRRLDGRVYSATLKTLNFNFHPSVVDDLKSSGFDIISLANNHSLDRSALGIDRTIEKFRSLSLPFVGTRHRDNPAPTWTEVVERRGMRIGWVACTYSTNGIPDRHNQVMFCYKHRDKVLERIRTLHADPKVDAVIVTPHWGYENQQYANGRQKRLARAMIDAGATAVIGAHPHVLQPWEKRTTAEGRDGLIIYSLGNFISNQRRLQQRAGLIALLELVKPNGAAKASLRTARYVPTWVVIDGRGHRVIENRGARGILRTSLRNSLRVLPNKNRISARASTDLTPQCARVPVVAQPATPPATAPAPATAAPRAATPPAKRAATPTLIEQPRVVPTQPKPQPASRSRLSPTAARIVRMKIPPRKPVRAPRSKPKGLPASPAGTAAGQDRSALKPTRKARPRKARVTRTRYQASSKRRAAPRRAQRRPSAVDGLIATWRTGVSR
ncbi:MAG: CapA family protein [Pseudomonadota bacterium]